MSSERDDYTDYTVERAVIESRWSGLLTAAVFLAIWAGLMFVAVHGDLPAVRIPWVTP